MDNLQEKKHKIQNLIKQFNFVILTTDSTTRQVSFFARGLKKQQPSSGEDLVFPYVLHNTGGAYSNTTGRFTAPLSGIYLFLVTVTRGTGVGKQAIVYLMQDGAWMSQARSGDVDYVTASTQAVLHVQAGGNVSVRAAGSDNYILDGYFSGTLITTDQ